MPQLRRLLAQGNPSNEAVQQLCMQFLASPDAISNSLLELLYATPSTVPNIAQGEPLAVLTTLDKSLIAVDNRPDPDAFEKMLTDALAVAALNVGDTAWFDGWCAPVWADLLDTLIADLLTGADGSAVVSLTRLLLVAGLIRDRAAAGKAFATPDAIYALLRYRNPVLPPDLFPRLLKTRSVQLVRDSTVSDLYVVRSEWRCFIASEICDIRNVMAHEHLNVKTVQIEQHEVMTDATQQTDTRQTTESDQTTKSDISEQTQRQMALSIQANGQVNVSAQYGTAKIEASGGVGASFSLADNNTRASQLSREVVARATSTVATSVRTERRDTTLTRNKQAFSHGFTNDTANSATGIYRWVDRVDRYQIFRYPDRLQLEFQLPEPGKYLRQRFNSANVPTDVDPPPPFTLKASAVTRQNYTNLAMQYRASGVPAPPAAQLAMSAVINAIPSAPPPNDWNTQYLAPVSGGTAEIALPSGYIASSLTVTGQAMPALGNWNREDTAHNAFESLGGFHCIALTATVGSKSFNTTQGGVAAGKNTVQDSGNPNAPVQFLDALCNFDFNDNAPPPLTQKAPVAINAIGAESVTATVEITCIPSDESMATWQQAVFDACLSAWQTWQSAWQSARSQLGITTGSIAERSPDRNAEMIQDEIKRQVVAWLLGEEPFQGRSALVGSIDTDITKAVAAAPDIQFLEQAFEWINVNYVPYPYYWAERRTQGGNDAAWNDLITIETGDDDLGRFLRAGSIRVVVPVRPGFTEAVMYYSLYGKPWQGGPPPIPGDPDYLSVAAEIHDMLVPPSDGTPGDSWETQLPTTFQWLDPSPQLPHNPNSKLGAAPNEPANPLCPAD
jgi:hypothetical protein